MHECVYEKDHEAVKTNVVLVRKKNGQLRICIDYRQLNNRTKRDNYALPRIDEILDSLSGNKLFSVLDMKSGYHQIPIAEEHKERTAFTVGTLGFFEYNRMPMGLTNAPATYQRLMEECLGDLLHRVCFIYLDDIIIFAKTFDEHQERLRMVFERLKECGIKLSPGKCALFMKKVKYVGHVVSENGIEPDEDKISKVKEWPRPTTSEEVRKFLGFVGYYRKFIQNFSKIARPLTDLIPTVSKTKTRKKTLRPVWKWEKEQEESFQTLKSKLASPPILAYPNFDLPFEIHTDASLHGLGAVLYQTQDGIQHVIAYASRGLSKSEKNYPAHKLEFLALKWAVTEKFQDYLGTKEFRVVTDNNPLTYVLTSAKLDATSHRWVAALAAYSFDIVYRPGRNNADGDSLSWLPGLEERQHISSDSVKAVCSIQPPPLIETLALTPDSIRPFEHVQQMHTIDVRAAQHDDPMLSDWIHFVRHQIVPQSHELPPTQESITFRKNFSKFKLQDETLYREISTENGQLCQLVIPPILVSEVLRYSHDKIGHPGRDRTTNFIRDRFFWPGMTNDIDYWIRGCRNCVLRKTPPSERAPLTNITTSQPLELVCMDYLSLETSKGGYPNILVITDHFTKYAVAVPTKNQTAKTVAEAFFNNFIIHYGFPKRIHTDQGANFESNLIKELCKLTGMEKSRTTPYHPMSNGITERLNRSLLGILGTLTTEQKKDWKRYVGPLVHAYNSLRHDTTGYSPYFLMFGRQPRLPVDIVFGLESGERNEPMIKYVSKMKDRLRKAYDLATKASGQSQDKQKANYDVRVRGGRVEIGDSVLVRKLAFDGKHKLANKWEDDMYIVRDQPNPDIPVYIVQREDGSGRKRTLHRNHLLPIGYLHDSDTPRDLRKTAPKKKVSRSRDSGTQNTDDTVVHEEGKSDTESETDCVTVHRPRQREVNHHDQPSDDRRDMSGQQDVEAARDASDTSPDVEVVSTPSSSNTAATSTSIVIESSHDSMGAQTDSQEQSSGSQPGRDTVDTVPDASTLDQTEVTPPESPQQPDSPQQTVRRSERTRRPPKWIRDGAFEVQAIHEAEQDSWSRKVEVLQHLVTTTDLFKGMENEVCRAILNVICEHK